MATVGTVQTFTASNWTRGLAILCCKNTLIQRQRKCCLRVKNSVVVIHLFPSWMSVFQAIIQRVEISKGWNILPRSIFATDDLIQMFAGFVRLHVLQGF